MVSSLPPETEAPSGNPLDLVEQVAIANEWSFQRQNDDELAAEISGHWCQYRMWFCWHPDLGVMHLSCALEMKVPANKRAQIYTLLALANEKLWLGHFDYWSDDGVAVFRHTIPMLDRIAPDPGEVAAILGAALDAADQFLPAFNFVVWAGKSPEEAVNAVVFETHGEA